MALSLSDRHNIELKVVSLKKSGKHIGRIISLTGVPRSQVRAILRDNGLLKSFRSLCKKKRKEG
jgi:hypothetical protein